MKSAVKLLPSLLLTIVMSGLAPVLVCGLVLTFCSVLWIIPGMTASILQEGLTEFLRIFGDGKVWEGILTIAIACGFVGGIFETFNFYYYQNTN